jgi:hypothetical protein
MTSAAKTVQILDQAKTVSISEDGKSVVVDEARLNVVSVGIQGPAGGTSLAGAATPESVSTDGGFLQYNANTGQWEIVTELDAGTF